MWVWTLLVPARASPLFWTLQTGKGKQMKLPTFGFLMITLSFGAACDRDNDRNDNHGAADNTGMQPPTARNDADPMDRGIQNDKKEVELDDRAENKREAEELVRKATATLEKMKRDEGLKKLLSESRGVMIVPEYGRAAVVVGGHAGEGILIAHRDGQTWSDPAFYDVGGVSLGAQLGAEGGEIALLFMDDKSFKAAQGKDSFSLNTGAGLTLVDYSKLAQTPLTEDAGNVVFWSDKEGAFIGVNLSITDVDWDDEGNAAYYGKTVKSNDIFEGRATTPKGNLQEQLTEI